MSQDRQLRSAARLIRSNEKRQRIEAGRNRQGAELFARRPSHSTPSHPALDWRTGERTVEQLSSLQLSDDQMESSVSESTVMGGLGLHSSKPSQHSQNDFNHGDSPKVQVPSGGAVTFEEKQYNIPPVVESGPSQNAGAPAGQSNPFDVANPFDAAPFRFGSSAYVPRKKAAASGTAANKTVINRPTFRSRPSESQFGLSRYQDAEKQLEHLDFPLWKKEVEGNAASLGSEEAEGDQGCALDESPELRSLYEQRVAAHVREQRQSFLDGVQASHAANNAAPAAGGVSTITGAVGTESSAQDAFAAPVPPTLPASVSTATSPWGDVNTSVWEPQWKPEGAPAPSGDPRAHSTNPFEGSVQPPSSRPPASTTTKGAPAYPKPNNTVESWMNKVGWQPPVEAQLPPPNPPARSPHTSGAAHVPTAGARAPPKQRPYKPKTQSLKRSLGYAPPPPPNPQTLEDFYDHRFQLPPCAMGERPSGGQIPSYHPPVKAATEKPQPVSCSTGQQPASNAPLFPGMVPGAVQPPDAKLPALPGAGQSSGDKHQVSWLGTRLDPHVQPPAPRQPTPVQTPAGRGLTPTDRTQAFPGTGQQPAAKPSALPGTGQPPAVKIPAFLGAGQQPSYKQPAFTGTGEQPDYAPFNFGNFNPRGSEGPCPVNEGGARRKEGSGPYVPQSSDKQPKSGMDMNQLLSLINAAGASTAATIVKAMEDQRQAAAAASALPVPPNGKTGASPAAASSQSTDPEPPIGAGGEVFDLEAVQFHCACAVAAARKEDAGEQARVIAALAAQTASPPPGYIPPAQTSGTGGHGEAATTSRGNDQTYWKGSGRKQRSRYSFPDSRRISTRYGALDGRPSDSSDVSDLDQSEGYDSAMRTMLQRQGLTEEDMECFRSMADLDVSGVPEAPPAQALYTVSPSDLPKFSGEIEEYQEFKMDFLAQIRSFPVSSRLRLLKTCLDEDSRQTLTICKGGGELAYAKAWKTLDRNLDHPNLVKQMLIQQITDLVSIKKCTFDAEAFEGVVKNVRVKYEQLIMLSPLNVMSMESIKVVWINNLPSNLYPKVSRMSHFKPDECTFIRVLHEAELHASWTLSNRRRCQFQQVPRVQAQHQTVYGKPAFNKQKVNALGAAEGQGLADGSLPAPVPSPGQGYTTAQQSELEVTTLDEYSTESLAIVSSIEAAYKARQQSGPSEPGPKPPRRAAHKCFLCKQGGSSDHYTVNCPCQVTDEALGKVVKEEKLCMVCGRPGHRGVNCDLVKVAGAQVLCTKPGCTQEPHAKTGRFCTLCKQQ